MSNNLKIHNTHEIDWLAVISDNNVYKVNILILSCGCVWYWWIIVELSKVTKIIHQLCFQTSWTVLPTLSRRQFPTIFTTCLYLTHCWDGSHWGSVTGPSWYHLVWLLGDCPISLYRYFVTYYFIWTPAPCTIPHVRDLPMLQLLDLSSRTNWRCCQEWSPTEWMRQFSWSVRRWSTVMILRTWVTKLSSAGKVYVNSNVVVRSVDSISNQSNFR